MSETIAFDVWLTRLRRLSADLSATLEKPIGEEFDRIESGIRRALNGEVLNRRSGDLFQSFRARADKDLDGISLSFSAGSSRVRYAAIHEFGGNTGRAVIPARPYMRPSIDSGLVRLEHMIGESIARALNEGRF